MHSIFKVFVQGPLTAFHQGLRKIFSQGKWQDHCKDLLSASRQDPHKISSQGPNLYKITQGRLERISPGALPQGPPHRLGQDLHARASKKELYKIFTQEPDKNIPAELSYKRIWDMACARFSLQEH